MRGFAWISTISLVLCGVPDLIAGLTTREVNVSLSLLSIWFLGEVSGLVYVLHRKETPLIFNYGLNTLIVGGLLWMKLNY